MTQEEINKLCDRVFKLDCENQHLKYYQEGYRESMLELIHGANYVWEKLNIDVDRFAPDGAKRNSYDHGWQQAIQDHKKI